MFLSPSILKKLMKEAYKRGLIVARTKEDWIYIAGSYWEMNVKKEFIPKKTMGDIIALIGGLPEEGERIRATEEGNQIEMEMPMKVKEEPFREKNALTVTDVILIGTAGTTQRLLQDEYTGDIYAINDVFVKIVDNKLIEEEKGEIRVEEPLYDPAYGILWKNNVCKMRAAFRRDDKNDKILKNLKGADITPELIG